MKKILIIEDEKNISSFVKMELEFEGYITQVIEDGKQGLDEAINKDYDLILLDLMLPSLNGIEICRRLKKEKDTPIIMLSAKDSVMDKVSGLQMGADDYVSKPFAIEELLARIQVVFRRDNNLNSKILNFKDLSINIDSRVVKKGDEELNLTNKEYELLLYLMENKDKVISRLSLLESVWGYNYETETNVVDVYVRHLRNKLDTEDKEEYIKTVRSIGYVMRS
ncbi:response regulator transcription factor [Paraclostridium bifermentans]|uniref:response regulator transcription factor n=2 Tax=Bacillota TaxID=1239 RepID=UPI001159281E|nr:response regulator transcription factor [Paraclostridium bifermentans]MCR1876349.1 response regulator transcription factor [Paraclostridium bifermentans]TQO57027.1 DNA-binding response regulator [Paraclostridium bifermentans]GKZ03236.1 DNA-binding response regulator [Paraclostridium bifermentans]GKZ07281.1 DNA-binding response regulator [Paraclostridium bifermentans]GKZ10326.1 DNA-binding response regulator [Paraclostridium bifermentans]